MVEIEYIALALVKNIKSQNCFLSQVLKKGREACIAPVEQVESKLVYPWTQNFFDESETKKGKL